jgi:hypothetical protein
MKCDEGSDDGEKRRRESDPPQDGVSYGITVEPCGRGTWVANWQWLIGHIGDGLSSTDPSPDEALNQTKFHLAPHHGHTHKK